MKLPARILLCVLCAALILATPFVVSSPTMLEEAKWEIIDQMEASEEDDTARLLDFLIPAARAEMAEAEAVAEAPLYELPIDLDPASVPAYNPANLTEAVYDVDGKTHTSGYEDETIRVSLEKREEDGKIWNIAWVEIASPTQLRTGVWATSSKDQSKAKSNNTGLGSKIAERYKAIVAIAGSNYGLAPKEKRFDVRMGLTHDNRLTKRDLLVIDENADFHILLTDERTQIQTFEQDTGHKIINAFTFGPALVRDGEVLTTPKDYMYNPTKDEPRAAIGQLAPLSYVMVVCDGRGKSGSEGATQQELANFMGTLNCQQAYAMDGGNGALLMAASTQINETLRNQGKGKVLVEYFSYKTQERDASDIIFFATAVPESEWK